MDIRQAVKLLIVGFIIGIAFVLPGVSGAVIAVVFGIYGRLITDISDLKKGIKEDFWFLLLLAAGLGAGFVTFSFVFDSFEEEYGAVMLLLFLGLIIGQIPEVCKIAKGDQPVKNSYIMWAVIGFAAMMVLLLLVGEESADVVMNKDAGGMAMSFGSGALLAVSGIIPGISGTSILLALGLFSPTMHIISDVNVLLFIPLVLGALIGMIFIAKIMNRLLNTRYHETYYAVLGLTIGSVILILPQIDTDVSIWWGILAVIIGLAVSLMFNILGKDIED